MTLRQSRTTQTAFVAAFLLLLKALPICGMHIMRKDDHRNDHSARICDLAFLEKINVFISAAIGENRKSITDTGAQKINRLFIDDIHEEFPSDMASHLKNLHNLCAFRQWTRSDRCVSTGIPSQM